MIALRKVVILPKNKGYIDYTWDRGHKMTYVTKGVCSKSINISVEDGIIKSVEFVGGCNGNLQGIGRLVQGMKVEEAIQRLKGICCGQKDTSCPDQLATALESMIETRADKQAI